MVLYHPNSEHSGMVLDYVRDCKLLKDKELELMSLETIEGSDLARLYDITAYPAIVALSNDGHLQKMWMGENFPTLNELDHYSLDLQKNDQPEHEQKTQAKADATKNTPREEKHIMPPTSHKE